MPSSSSVAVKRISVAPSPSPTEVGVAVSVYESGYASSSVKTSLMVVVLVPSRITGSSPPPPWASERVTVKSSDTSNLVSARVLTVTVLVVSEGVKVMVESTAV